MRLEEEVKRMINNEDGAIMLNKPELVDDIQRLGFGYRFQEDIKKALDGIYTLDQGFNGGSEKSLHAASLGFRLLREHGYEVSQGT